MMQNSRVDRGAPVAPSTRSPVALGRYRGWLLACLLIGVTAGLRAPTWNDHILFIDEPIYYSFAARLELPGAHLYTHTADQKPPLGPLTYWLAIQMNPAHAITVIHVFTTIAIALTAGLLLAGSEALLGSPWAGLIAGVLYATISSGTNQRGESWFAFSSLEHFQAPLLLSFVVLFVLSLRKRRASAAAIAGVMLGAAALYKPNVIVLLGAAGLVAVHAVARRQLRLRRAAALAAIAALSTLAVVGAVPLYYALMGRFAAWRLYNVDMLVAYHAMAGPPVREAALLADLIPLRPLLLIGLLYATLMVLARRSKRCADVGLFLAATWVFVFLSLVPGQHKAHYLVQGLPAQCLLIGMVIVDAGVYLVRARRRGAIAVGVFCAGLLLYPATLAMRDLYQGWRRLGLSAAADDYLAIHRANGTLSPVTEYIREHSTPADLIYVHSEAPEFYFLTQRRPAASDPTGSWIAMLPSAAAADRLLADLQATPPRLIVQLAYRRYGRAGEVLQKWPQLRAWVTAHYREQARIRFVQILEWYDPPAAAATN